jgi:hypothetical protein
MSSNKTVALLKNTFLTPPNTVAQFLIIFVAGLLFIWMPQRPPVDWDLNTNGFWSNISQTYINNRNFVYPPWGLILMLPYYLIHATGARIFSVITIGWLAYIRKWPLSHFFIIILSPYFLITMTKSNMDILAIILPILIWERSKGKRWEGIARGISLSILLLKPQCTVFILLYLLWTNRKEWKKVLAQFGVTAFFIIPVSCFGSPPLFSQWLKNIIYPTSQNQFYWSINNISLTAKFGFLIALGILFSAILILFLSYKARFISWNISQTTSSLLLCSMYLLPYTSQQSFSSGLAFIPSWPGFFIQWLVVVLGIVIFGNYDKIPSLSFLAAFLSLLLFSITMHRNKKDLQSKNTVSQSIL